MLLAPKDIMPRKPSGLPPKVHYRRAPAWCAQFTDLVERAAQIAKEKRIYLTHAIEWGGQVNTAGVVQAVLIQAALYAHEIKPEQWARYMDTYGAMVFTGETKGIVFDERSLTSFREVGKAMVEQPHSDDIKMTWRGEYHYPLVITIALMWFIDTYQ